MSVTVKISRSERQWVAEVPKAVGFVATSPSLGRLRKQVDKGLAEFYPELSEEERREVFDLPSGATPVLKDLAKAERDAAKAQQRVATLKKRASRRLKTKLGISVREIGALMGVSGARVQQLLKD